MIDRKSHTAILVETFTNMAARGGRMNERVSFHQKWYRSLQTVAVLAIATIVQAAPAAAATVCEKLAGAALPNAKIDSAQMIAAGAFVQPGGRGAAAAFAKLPAFCRVAATLTPTSDSDIKTEIWL